MSRYHHRKNGTPVQAIQFTNEESIIKIIKEFHCDVLYDEYKGWIYIGDTKIEKGQYAVQAFPAIVAIDQDKFDYRYKKDETQLELF